MLMLRRISAFFFACLLLWPAAFLHPHAEAADPQAEATGGFSLSLSKTELRPGGKCELTLFYEGEPADIGAFVVSLTYDSSLLSYVKTENGTAVRADYSKTEQTPGHISSVYTAKNPGTASSLRGELFRYTFTAAADADAGEIPFQLSVGQIVDHSGEKAADDLLLSCSAALLPPLAADCSLLSLQPSEGDLFPAFHPDVTAYEIDVPFTIKEMAFDAQASPGAVWKVNRKNLGAGGSATDFVIAVTSEDGSRSQKYTVTVNRGVKAAASPAPSGGKTADSKTVPGKAASSAAKSAAAKSQTVKNSSTAGGTAKANAATNGADGSQTILRRQNAQDLSVPGAPLVIESSGFSPFLWGAFGTLLLILLVYLISLQLKLLILKKEEKLALLRQTPALSADRADDSATTEAPANPVDGPPEESQPPDS